MDFNVVVAQEIHTSLVQRHPSSTSSRENSEDYRTASNVSSPVHDNDFNSDLVHGFKDRPATKRKRHNLTPAQSRVLEKAFSVNPHPGRKMRIEISNMIKLDIDKVRKWFENRRNKAKKMLQSGHISVPDPTVRQQVQETIFQETLLSESGDVNWKVSLFPNIGMISDADTRPAAIISSMRSQNSSIRSSIECCSDSDSNYSEPEDHQILKASSVSGEQLGEMVAPYVSEFIFHVATQIRDRFQMPAVASQIVMAQETFRTDAEKLFQSIHYDCRMSLAKPGMVYDTCCFSFFIGVGTSKFCEVTEIRLNCVAESDEKSLKRVVFHIHTACNEEFSLGCRRAISHGGKGEIWGDTSRLKKLLDVTMHNQDLWSLLMFLGLGRPCVPEHWLLELIASV